MPYVSEAEKEAARWMSEAEALEHICKVDRCDLAEAQRQLRNAIIDHRDMVYLEPLHHRPGQPIRFPTKAEQLRDAAKPKRILRERILSLWRISNQTFPFGNVTGAFEPPISQPSEHLPQTANSQTSGRYSHHDLSEWYKKWLLDCAAAKRRPSRKQDWEAAKVAVGGKISRDAVYELRRSLAPPEWKKGGRPEAKKKCGDE